jgi:transitional endoplasmic reticulum ATPase
MLAKAVATESDRTFLAVSGPELKAPYVGQTEAQIRRVFETAREKAPSVVFFDEFDALAPDRGTVGSATYKVDHVNTLLAELDGLTEGTDILVIAATNRPEAIDPAILRPGRLGEHIEVPIPEDEARGAVVAATVADYPLADDVTPAWVTEQLPWGVSAATIVGVCEGALRIALRDVHEASVDDPEDTLVVTRTNVRRAIATMEDEVSEEADNDLRGFI